MKTDVMSAEEAQRLKTDARLAREFADVKDREAAWIALELAEAQRERDALHAQLAQVTAERDALRARAELAETERADALSELTRVIRECDVLREIVEGSTTPPSDEEIAAHEASSRGWWLFVLRGYPDVSTSPREAREWAQHHREHHGMYGCRWWPLDTHGRPCAWPVVDR